MSTAFRLSATRACLAASGAVLRALSSSWILSHGGAAGHPPMLASNEQNGTELIQTSVATKEDGAALSRNGSAGQEPAQGREPW
jgi:hypothetical protein